MKTKHLACVANNSFGEATKIVKPYRVINITKSLETGFTLTLMTYGINVWSGDTGEPIIPPI